MLYKGKAICENDGEFEWQIFQKEKNQFVFGKDLISKYVKSYDKKLGLVIANCPKCGCSIEITDYKFNKE